MWDPQLTEETVPPRMSECCFPSSSLPAAQEAPSGAHLELGQGSGCVCPLRAFLRPDASFFTFGQQSSAPITIFSVFAHQGCLSASREPTKLPGLSPALIYF